MTCINLSDSPTWCIHEVHSFFHFLLLLCEVWAASSRWYASIKWRASCVGLRISRLGSMQTPCRCWDLFKLSVSHRGLGSPGFRVLLAMVVLEWYSMALPTVGTITPGHCRQPERIGQHRCLARRMLVALLDGYSPNSINKGILVQHLQVRLGVEVEAAPFIFLYATIFFEEGSCSQPSLETNQFLSFHLHLGQVRKENTYHPWISDTAHKPLK